MRGFQQRGQPVISVDTKKKELVGTFKNGGREWQPKGEPQRVQVHDFLDPELGKAIPYGVYDLSENEGWVSVGIDRDIARFAAEAIRRWWKKMGSKRYRDATADGGVTTAVGAACGSSPCTIFPPPFGHHLSRFAEVGLYYIGCVRIYRARDVPSLATFSHEHSVSAVALEHEIALDDEIHDEEKRFDTDLGEHDRRAELVRQEVDHPVRNDPETRHGQEIAQHRGGQALLARPEHEVAEQEEIDDERDAPTGHLRDQDGAHDREHADEHKVVGSTANWRKHRRNSGKGTVLGPHPARPDLRPLLGGVKMLGVTRREQAVHVGLGQADPFLEALVYRTVVLLVTDVGAHQRF